MVKPLASLKGKGVIQGKKSAETGSGQDKSKAIGRKRVHCVSLRDWRFDPSTPLRGSEVDC